MDAGNYSSIALYVRAVAGVYEYGTVTTDVMVKGEKRPPLKYKRRGAKPSYEAAARACGMASWESQCSGE